mmetsp:Transcript_74437/g.177582  ORF Transcript_74437/g.177582 Transcript_74437/m.177582 type:complete len:278 (+) Transcript_74437:185-1018(+)
MPPLAPQPQHLALQAAGPAPAAPRPRLRHFPRHGRRSGASGSRGEAPLEHGAVAVGGQKPVVIPRECHHLRLPRDGELGLEAPVEAGELMQQHLAGAQHRRTEGMALDFLRHCRHLGVKLREVQGAASEHTTCARRACSNGSGACVHQQAPIAPVHAPRQSQLQQALRAEVPGPAEAFRGRPGLKEGAPASRGHGHHPAGAAGQELRLQQRRPGHRRRDHRPHHGGHLVCALQAPVASAVEPIVAALPDARILDDALEPGVLPIAGHAHMRLGALCL